MGEQITPTAEKKHFQDELNWYCAMVNMASSHLDRIGAEALPLDTHKYPAQDPKTSFVDGKNLALSSTANLAEKIQPGYRAEIDRLRQDASVAQGIGFINESRRNRQNVFIVVPHTDLNDLVFATLAVRDLIALHAKKPDKPPKVDMIISKAISVIPNAIDSLGVFTDRIYLTMPQTETAQAATTNLSADEVQEYNKLAMMPLGRRLIAGGSITGVAPTATTRQSINPNIDNDTLKILTKSSRRIPSPLLLPVSVIFPHEPNDESGFQIVIGTPKQCQTQDDIFALLESVKNHTRAGVPDLGTMATKHNFTQ